MKNWNKITVRHYQQILPIIEDESFTDLDKLVKVICVLTGLNEEEVDSWPLSKINDRWVFVNGAGEFEILPGAPGGVGLPAGTIHFVVSA